MKIIFMFHAEDNEKLLFKPTVKTALVLLNDLQGTFREAGNNFIDFENVFHF